MSDNPPKAQAKITSFFSKPVIQRTLTTSLVPDRKRKLDDTEPEESNALQSNKKQKIAPAIVETTQSVDGTSTRNTLQSSSKSRGNLSPDGVQTAPHQSDHSPTLTAKPLLNRAQTVSGSTTFAALERQSGAETSRVAVKRAVTWRSTQMSDEHAGVTLVVAMGDLTHERCDAIVNAANSALAHGGGVAGAISRAAGPVLDRESREWVREHGRVEAGQVAVTSAGRLRDIKHVIHAVGPLWEGCVSDELSADETYDIDDRTLARSYVEDEVLRETVRHSLECAHQLRASSIALPAISSGIFGYPKRRCAAVLVRTAIEYIESTPHTTLTQIRFTNFDRATVEIFLDEFEAVFGPA